MKGSPKQVKWANDIRESKNFDKFIDSARSEAAKVIVTKAVNFVKGIDNAKFWIDYRNSSEMDIFNSLMTGGLKVNGHNNSRTAKMAQDGAITITEKVIVQDGKGGHYETRTETI
jgi:hypothetical protein